jgi:peptidyl-prolyl cis-trans isomerase C
MTRSCIILPLILFLSVPLAQAQAKPYVTVNGYAIPQYMVDAFIADLKARGMNTDSPYFQKVVREEMIRRGVLLSEAKKRALEKRPEYKQQLEIASHVILMRDVVIDYLVRNPVSDADLQSAYDAAVVRLGDSEYKLRHIQLKSEADAKVIIGKLEDGKEFEELAEESIDDTSKDKGGDLGWKTQMTLPPAVIDAVRSLKKGDFTRTPVNLGAVWHVFQLEDLRPLNPPPLAELKPGLMQSLMMIKAAQYIDNLKSKAKIK